MKKVVLTLLALVMTLGLAAQNTDVVMRINGVRLAAAGHCSQSVQDGMHSYVLKDKVWGPKAVVRVKEVPSLNGHQTFWRLRTTGFEGAVTLDVTGKGATQQQSQTFEDECYVILDGSQVTIDLRGDERFDEAEASLKQVASSIRFSTPDPAVNALGSVLAISSYNASRQTSQDEQTQRASQVLEDEESKRAARVLECLFGIPSDSVGSRYVLRPDFPVDWDSASVRTPYIYYSYRRYGDEAVFDVSQYFRQSRKIVVRQNLGRNRFRDVEGSSAVRQTIRVKIPNPLPAVSMVSNWPDGLGTEQWHAYPFVVDAKFRKQNISKLFNASVSDVAGADDADLRARIVKDEVVVDDILFRSPAEGDNVVCTSLSESYPDSVMVPLSGSASSAWLLLANSGGQKEQDMAYAEVVVTYKDGSSDTLPLTNAINQVFRVPLDIEKKLQALTLHALSADSVIGLMAVTLQ